VLTAFKTNRNKYKKSRFNRRKQAQQRTENTKSNWKPQSDHGKNVRNQQPNKESNPVVHNHFNDETQHKKCWNFPYTTSSEKVYSQDAKIKMILV